LSDREVKSGAIGTPASVSLVQSHVVGVFFGVWSGEAWGAGEKCQKLGWDEAGQWTTEEAAVNSEPLFDTFWGDY
jgi:hypothetical protein